MHLYMYVLYSELTISVGAVNVDGLVFSVVHKSESIHTANTNPTSTEQHNSHH